MILNKYSVKPKAASKDLVVQEVGQELLVYNLSNDKVMSLNSTLTVIWQLCDGEKDLVQIRKSASENMNSIITDELIFLAIDELKQNRLISTETAENEQKISGFSRRELIKRVGVTTSVAIPVITGIIAPQAIFAASGNSCTQDLDCPSLCCITNSCTQFNPGGTIVGNPCFVDLDCQSNCCDTGICAPACGVCFV